MTAIHRQLARMAAVPRQPVHAGLFQPQWWRALQAQLRAGHWPDTPPYPDALRLA